MNQNKHHSVSHGKTMPYISKEDMYVYCSFHVTAVVGTCGLYAVVNKLTKCLITGCKQKKHKTLWIELLQVLGLCVFLNSRYSSKYFAEIYRASKKI